MKGVRKLKSSDILLDAAGLIRKSGLARGHFRGHDGGYCARGAIRATVGEPMSNGNTVTPTEKQVLPYVMEELARHTQGLARSSASKLATWNNYFAESAEEVAMVLERAGLRAFRAEIVELSTADTKVLVNA